MWVNHSEMGEIASFLGITPAAFAKNYLKSINGRLSLLEYGERRLCNCMTRLQDILAPGRASARHSVLDVESGEQR